MFTKSLASLVLVASAAFAAPTASSKRGICFDSTFSSATNLFSNPRISWGYNWADTQWGPTALPSNIREFVPMCWGNKKASHGWAECESLKQSVVSGATKPAHVLGFNEPDIPFPQAEMSPTTAADAWRTYLQPMAGKTRLGAPSISNSEEPGKGISWLKEFFAVCKDCTFDFFPIHWYSDGPTPSFDYFKRCIENARKAIIEAGYPGQVWLTEFGVTNADPAVQMEFMETALAWLEAPEQNWIERYSQYGALPGDVRTAHMVDFNVPGQPEMGFRLNEVGAAYAA